ncbi:MAG: hypothetical protein IPJ61_18865 [Tessaracoccus sp.]|uniref:hypothetical protein n=1 Tax=Tessaracoccus sp. TaxID=1971211 RepID=UPI001EC9C188|nr:hypothetical protein [Tessaracoccus sp.]MBK7823048.1 hypothetical protein [Tessaracoccus sp.]
MRTLLTLITLALTLATGACACPDNDPGNDPPTPPQLITCASVGCGFASRQAPACTEAGCTCTKDAMVLNCLPDCQGVCVDKTTIACDAQGCVCEATVGTIECTP